MPRGLPLLLCQPLRALSRLAVTDQLKVLFLRFFLLLIVTTAIAPQLRREDAHPPSMGWQLLHVEQIFRWHCVPVGLHQDVGLVHL